MTAQELKEIFADAKRSVANWPEWKRNFSIIAMTSSTLSEITPGQVLDIRRYCPECGEPRPSCVCEVEDGD